MALFEVTAELAFMSSYLPQHFRRDVEVITIRGTTSPKVFCMLGYILGSIYAGFMWGYMRVYAVTNVFKSLDSNKQSKRWWL